MGLLPGRRLSHFEPFREESICTPPFTQKLPSSLDLSTDSVHNPVHGRW